MKKYLLSSLVLLALVISPSFAQQDPMYSQYMFNTLAINPAYAGSRDVLSVTSLFRKQWVGFDGAPNSQTLTADMPIRDKSIGLGLQVYNDKLGVTNNTGIYGSYAYRIRFVKGTLAFGLQGGFSQFRADLTSVQLDKNSGQDEAFAQNLNVFLPNVGTGVYYNTDRFYVGLSVPHLINNKLDKYDRVDFVSNRAVQSRHVFASAGYVFDISPTLKLKPSVLVKMVNGAPLNVDANTNLWIHEKIAFGLSYRTGDSMLGMFEVQLNNQFRLGYAYDWTISGLQRYNSGSHELMLRYEFSFEKDKYISPRFF
jgi:type IX secretion system PorP/SprF family membrane protein